MSSSSRDPTPCDKAKGTRQREAYLIGFRVSVPLHKISCQRSKRPESFCEKTPIEQGLVVTFWIRSIRQIRSRQRSVAERSEE